ncbi:MAG: RNA-binding protein [Candidatus Rokuibacteriota bacterium]|nr:MAG: RNA-binding protein [Candidatus Rokubacteria bacterium]
MTPAELIDYLVRRLVDEPDAVRVEEVETDGDLLLQLHVAEADRGKIIGRRGRMVRALRTVARASGARGDRRILLEIVE